MEYGKSRTTLDRPGRPAARLLQIVTAMLLKRGVHRPVDSDDQLTDLGLTSLDLANLLLAIEAEFDLTIPAEELTAANFRSIASLEEMISRVRAQGAAGRPH